MSLRARITVSAASAVAIAVLVVAVGVYAATAGRLQRQVDAELDRAARAVLEIATEDGTIGARLAVLERLRDADRGRGRGGGPGGGPGGPGNGDLERFTGPFGAGILQAVSPAGETVTLGAVELPVDDTVLAIAAAGAGTDRTTVEVDGRSVRVLTVGVQDAGALQLGASVADIDRAVAALRRQLVLAGLLGVGLAALLGAVVARRAVRPVRELTEAAEEVGRTADLTTRIEGEGDDELGRLAASFNGMLAGLERARRSQQQLIADASHELRTPLTSLRTNVEVLQLTDALPPAEREALLRDLNAQLVEFGKIVDGLVELARGDVPARAPTDVELGQVVGEVVDRAAVFAPGVRFEVTTDGSVVRAERDRLERAVANMVDNAVKHGGGSTVEVSVAGGVVRVRDHGPGIPDDAVPHVFDRFYRAPGARSLPGSGLGLSIVAQVAAAHAGTVGARTHPEGGAEVELRLPLA